MITWFAAMFAWMSAHGFDLQTLVAGFLGGVVRSLVSRVGTVGEGLISGFTGCIFAAYFGASVATLAAIAYPTGCFVAGMLGMSAAEALMKVAKAYVRDPGAVRDGIVKVLTRNK